MISGDANSAISSPPRPDEGPDHGGSHPYSSPIAAALRELLEVGCHVGPAVARRAELSHSELTTLELLGRGPVGPAHIARTLGVTSAAASHIVERLVARQHAQRRPHRTDGRRVEVVLTESGRREVMSHLLPMITALADLDAGLTDTDRAVVYDYLTGATAAMRKLL